MNVPPRAPLYCRASQRKALAYALTGLPQDAQNFALGASSALQLEHLRAAATIG